MRLKMRLEDAMVYVLATAGYGMTTQRIAEVIIMRNSTFVLWQPCYR